ncbi:UNVERIFIED_CONTAM: hypothetical protein PYX00_003951 [Menopon gallinae]|uniref:Putative ionotropic receptor ligand binding domain-containing protein n=1 Tax=Menopon gallinae TaxID=328185 RepID=A0AAW2I2T5_9NEOP
MNCALILLFFLKITKFTASDIITDLDDCLTEIVNTYFNGQAIRVYIKEICQEDVDETGFLPLLNSSCFVFPRVNANVSFEVVTRDQWSRSKNTVIFTTKDDRNALKRTISEMKMTSLWNTNVLVVLFQEAAATEVLEGIFEEVWNKTRLINTVIMTVQDGDFSFHSWYPYEEGNCGSVVNVSVVDSWKEGGFVKKSDLFPKSPLSRGLNGCPIQARTNQSYFFTLIDNLLPNDSTDGLDFRIIREMGRYGLSLKYQLPDEHFLRFDQDGNLAGSMKALFDYEIDITFSGAVDFTGNVPDSHNVCGLFRRQGVMTSPPQYSPYSSIEDVLDMGLTLNMYPGFMNYFANDSLRQKIFKSGHFEPAKEPRTQLQEIIVDKTSALLLGEARLTYLVAQQFHDDFGKPLFDFLPPVFSINLMAFHFSPNCPLKGLFDRKLRTLLENGIVAKWKKDLLRPKGKPVSVEPAVKQLKLINLNGVFQLYGILICFSFIVFLCELFTVYVKRVFVGKKATQPRLLNRTVSNISDDSVSAIFGSNQQKPFS